MPIAGIMTPTAKPIADHHHHEMRRRIGARNQMPQHHCDQHFEQQRSAPKINGHTATAATVRIGEARRPLCHDLAEQITPYQIAPTTKKAAAPARTGQQFESRS